MSRLTAKIRYFAHRAFLIGSVTALLAILIVWPFSYFRSLVLMANSRTLQITVEARNGRFGLVFGDLVTSSTPTWFAHAAIHEADPNTWSYGEWASFDANLSIPFSGYKVGGGLLMVLNDVDHFGFIIAVPFSYFTLLLSIYPALTYYRHRKTRRLKLTANAPAGIPPPSNPSLS